MSNLCADFRCSNCNNYFEFFVCDYEERHLQRCPVCDHSYLDRVYTPLVVKVAYDKDGSVHRVIRRVKDTVTGVTKEENITEAVKAGFV